MRQFFLNQLDFVFFVYGLSFILLAAQYFVLRRRNQELPWGLLAAFGLAHGLNEWLDMVALALPDTVVFQWFRLGVMAASFVALAEFGRQGLARHWRLAAGRWLTPMLVGFAALGALSGGINGLNAACRYALGFPGAMMAAAALLRCAPVCADAKRPVLRVAAYSVFAYGLATGLVVPKAGFFPATMVNHDAFLLVFGFPVQLLRAVLALAIAVDIWRFIRAEDSYGTEVAFAKDRREYARVFVILMALVILGGWGLACAIGQLTVTEMEGNLLQVCTISAAALDQRHVQALTGAPRDERTPGYARLRQQLTAMRQANPECRQFYLMMIAGGRTVFTVDSEPISSHLHTPPGFPYSDAPRDLRPVFASGRPAVTGPYTDQWGTWESAFVAIPQGDKRKQVAVLGMDVDAAKWNAILRQERLEPIAITLLIAALVIAFFVAYERRVDSEAAARASEREKGAEKEQLDVTLRSIGDGVIATDVEGKIILLNAVAERLTGCTESDAAGKPLTEVFRIINADTRRTVEDPVKKAMEVGEVVAMADDTVLIARDGTERRIADSAAPIRDADGEVRGAVLVFHDVTAEYETKRALRESEGKFRGLFESSRDAIMTLEPPSWRFTSCNAATLELFGAEDVEEFVSLGPWEVSPETQPDGQASGEKAKQMIEMAMRDGSHFFEWTHMSVAGKTFPATVLLTRMEQGGKVFLQATVRDVTERKQAEEKIEILARFPEENPNAVLRINERGVVLYANRPGRLLLRTLGGKVGCPAPADWQDWVARAAASRVHQGVEVEYGESVYAFNLTPVQQGGYVNLYVHDITEQKRADQQLIQSGMELERLNAELEAAVLRANELAKHAETARALTEEKAVELDYRSTHDALTNLPNRQSFEASVRERTGPTGRATKRPFAIMFLDLDRFKLVNDTLGHNAGDTLLVEIALRLQSCLRSGDLLSRMGGDEFTAILPRLTDRASAEAVAARMLDSISRPFDIAEHRLVIGGSIGMALYPSDGVDSTTLLRHADAAMYRAKQSGGGTYRWFTGDADIDNQARADIENGLRKALECGQFAVHYQPIIDLSDGSLHGAEALLRWEHPEKGAISPSLFIPIAEEVGLIGPIGDYVLRSACLQAKSWRDGGMPLSQISVNISATQARELGWADSVKALLSDTGLDACRLSLELTETDLVVEHGNLTRSLRALRDLGVSLAMDDFGVGQSSLSRLADFPVVHLKIDGSFVRDIGTDGNNKTMLESIVDMAHKLGIKVTAEWVETEVQMEALRRMSCDYAQGYFISPPLPAEKFQAFVAERAAETKRRRRAA